jgi:hypothetical protein
MLFYERDKNTKSTRKRKMVKNECIEGYQGAQFRHAGLKEFRTGSNHNYGMRPTIDLVATLPKFP